MADTIAALATPAAPGAIAILRLSGDDCLMIAEKVFKGKKLNKRVIELLDNNPNTITPIADIIDIEKYKTLNDIEKQNYILNISEKFCKIKEEYYKKQTSI